MTPDAGRPLRIVVFGVTGQVGQELVEQLDEREWPVAELVGVASADSAGTTFSFRSQELDVAADVPKLSGHDVVFLCTRDAPALELVRECLRAEVPCIDLTGALVAQGEVPLPFAPVADAEPSLLQKAPLLACPSPTALAWATIVDALGGADDGALLRIGGTILSSASARGRAGLVALSEESIALFNQSEAPETGPAGQTVAFDVIPGGGVDLARLETELRRHLGEGPGIGGTSLQIPTFVGEGSALLLEFAESQQLESIAARLEAVPAIDLVADGPGSRGLALVADEDEADGGPLGPTLRDAAGQGGLRIGRIELDGSIPDARGVRLWVAMDPLRVAADHALDVAAARLGSA